jgi:hypothetical protein
MGRAADGQREEVRIMGIIDQSYARLTCGECDVSEVATAFDRGSGWRGSSWGHYGEVSGFVVEQSGGGTTEPTISTVTCTVCGTRAVVETSYTKFAEDVRDRDGTKGSG